MFLFVSCNEANGNMFLNVVLSKCFQVPASMRDWWNTVGHLIELFLINDAYHGPQFTDACVNNNRLVRFRRNRDFQQYYFNSIPPTPQSCRYFR